MNTDRIVALVALVTAAAALTVASWALWGGSGESAGDTPELCSSINRSLEQFAGGEWTPTSMDSLMSVLDIKQKACS